MQSASVRSILPEQHPVGIQGKVCPRRRPHIRGRAPVPSELDVPQLLLPLRELLEHRARRYAPPRAREHGPVEGPGAHDGDGLVLADLAAGAGLDLGSGGGAGREEVVAALIDPGERDGARGRVGLVEKRSMRAKSKTCQRPPGRGARATAEPLATACWRRARTVAWTSSHRPEAGSRQRTRAGVPLP